MLLCLLNLQSNGGFFLKKVTLLSTALAERCQGCEKRGSCSEENKQDCLQRRAKPTKHPKIGSVDRFLVKKHAKMLEESRAIGQH